MWPFNSRTSKERKKVILITSARPSGYFFSSVVSSLAVRLDSHGYDLVLKVPKGDYIEGDQVTLFERFRNQRKTFEGLVLIPVPGDEMQDNVVAFRRADPKYPFVIFDVHFDQKPFDRYGVKHPYTMMSQNEEGGQIAASEIVIPYLEKRNIKAPLVGIIPGNYESGRERAFTDVITGQYGGKALIWGRKRDFDFKGGLEEAKRLLEERLDSNLDLFDVLFCANDEMAIGARSAMVRLWRQVPELSKKDAITHVKIVGFDGIVEMKTFINDQEKCILGTVDVLIGKQIEALFHEFLRQLKGEVSGPEHEWVHSIPPIKRVNKALL